MEKINDYEKLGELFHVLVENYSNLEHKNDHNHKLKHLTSADVRALINIGHLHRERMTNLAKHLNLTVGTLTNTIDRLVKKGYVLRYRSEEDRRIVEVCLSPKGEDIFNEIRAQRKLRAEKFFSQLNDEEKLALNDLFSKLVRNSNKIVI
jgi:DNA-binding MarR family transcriptional regulator